MPGHLLLERSKMSEQSDFEALFDEFLSVIEFQLVKHTDGWGVEDRQGANLGDIEQDRFKNALSLIDRLDIYIQDYFVSVLEDGLGAERYDNWKLLLEAADEKLSSDGLNQYRFELKILDMICNHPGEINLERCNYLNETNFLQGGVIPIGV